jgi:hypothetical protein
MYMLRGSLPW